MCSYSSGSVTSAWYVSRREWNGFTARMTPRMAHLAGSGSCSWLSSNRSCHEATVSLGLFGDVLDGHFVVGEICDCFQLRAVLCRVCQAVFFDHFDLALFLTRNDPRPRRRLDCQAVCSDSPERPNGVGHAQTGVGQDGLGPDEVGPLEFLPYFDLVGDRASTGLCRLLQSRCSLSKMREIFCLR